MVSHRSLAGLSDMDSQTFSVYSALSASVNFPSGPKTKENTSPFSVVSSNRPKSHGIVRCPPRRSTMHSPRVHAASERHLRDYLII